MSAPNTYLREEDLVPEARVYFPQHQAAVGAAYVAHQHHLLGAWWGPSVS